MRVQFSANLLIGTLKPLLCGIMNEAVKDGGSVFRFGYARGRRDAFGKFPPYGRYCGRGGRISATVPAAASDMY